MDEWMSEREVNTLVKCFGFWRVFLVLFCFSEDK